MPPKRRDDAAAKRAARVAKLQKSIERNKLKAVGEQGKMELIELIEGVPEPDDDEETKRDIAELKKGLDGLCTATLRDRALRLARLSPGAMPEDQVREKLPLKKVSTQWQNFRSSENPAQASEETTAIEEGDMVVLSNGVDKECLDTPGKIGKVEEVQHDPRRYKVRDNVRSAQGKTKWCSGDMLKRLENGDMVVLRRGVDKVCLDTPGKIGEVVEVQHKRLRCNVRSFQGKTQWYSGAALKCFDGTPPSKIALMQAAQRGDVDAIGQCVFSGRAIDTKDATGATALHYAAGAGQLEALRTLIDNHGKVDEPNNAGQTPLFFAADTETIRLLLKKGADPAHVDHRGRTAAEVLDPPLPAAKGARQSSPKSVARSSVTLLPSPHRGGSSMSVRSSMSGVAASTLSLRPPPRRQATSDGRGNVARHSWAGDRMPDAASRSDPSALLNIDRRRIDGMELGAFIEQGYAAHRAAADADERARLRASLCNHMEDALYMAECRMHKMALEIKDMLNEGQPSGEPEKAYLCVYQKEEEDGQGLTEAVVKEKFKKEIFTCFKGVKEISGKLPENTQNERAKSKRDGIAFEVMLQAESNSEEHVAVLKCEVQRAVAEQTYVPIYASDVDPRPPEPAPADSGSGAPVVLGPGGGVLDEQGKPGTEIENSDMPAKLWLTAHSSMNETYAKRFIKALNESQKDMLRRLAEHDEALTKLDEVAEPMMAQATENMAKDDIMNAKTAEEFWDTCHEEYQGVIKVKYKKKGAKLEEAQKLFGKVLEAGHTPFLTECEARMNDKDSIRNQLDDSDKVRALRDMIYNKVYINDPTKVEQVVGHPGTVECTMTSADEVKNAKRLFKSLRVPAEDAFILDAEGTEMIPAKRYSVTLGGAGGTEEVAGPLFGLVISQLKPMIPDELEGKIDESKSHIKQSKSRHTERDPDSIKDWVCPDCEKCEVDDPKFEDHECIEGVCRGEYLEEDKKCRDCFTKKHCKDKFGKPRTRLGMLCEKCRKCEKCIVRALWDRPGEGGGDAADAPKKDQPLDPDENTKGGPFSYLIRVRTGVSTATQDRSITSATDSGIFITLIGQKDGEDKPVYSGRLQLEHYMGLVRTALEDVRGVARAVVSAERNGLNPPGTTTVHLDLSYSAGVKPSALMDAIIATTDVDNKKMILAGVGKGRGLTSEILWKSDEKNKAEELIHKPVLPPGPIRLRVDGLKVSQWLEAPTISAPGGEGAFEEGQTSTFRIDTDVDVGQVMMVLVEQDGTGERPGWFLDEVTIAQEGYVGIVRVALEAVEGVDRVELTMEATVDCAHPGTATVYLSAPMKPQVLIDAVQEVEEKYRCGLSAILKGQQPDVEVTTAETIVIVVDGLTIASRGDAKFFCRKWLDVTKDDLQTSRLLTPFRPPVDASLRPARSSEYIKLKESISKVDDVVFWIDLLLTVQRQQMEKDIAGEHAQHNAQDKAAAETQQTQSEPEPEPMPEAQRLLRDQRRRQNKAALAKLRAAAHTDMQTLETLSRSAKLVLNGLPESKIIKPEDINKDDEITWNEILGALHRDRRGLRKMVEEWEHEKLRDIDQRESDGGGGKEESLSSYGLEGWQPYRERMVEELSKLRSSLIDSLDSRELVRWFVKMGFPKGHELILAIQHSDCSDPTKQVEQLNGKTLREEVTKGGFEQVLKRTGAALTGSMPFQNDSAHVHSENAAAQFKSGLRGTEIILPSDAFDLLLVCSSSATLRRKGRELKSEWYDQVGCLDGMEVSPIAVDTSPRGEDGGDEAKTEDGPGTEPGKAVDPDDIKQQDLEDLNAELKDLGLSAYCDALRKVKPHHTSIASLSTLDVPELASLAEELKMEAGEVLRLSRYLRRPGTPKPCRYCRQVRRHSNHESWQVALAGEVRDELAKNDTVASGPKWESRFQSIREWFKIVEEKEVADEP